MGKISLASTPPSPSNESNLWKHVFAGWTFAITVVLGVAAGIWIDRHWECDPWGTVIGSLVGIGAGFYGLIREFKDDSST